MASGARSRRVAVAALATAVAAFAFQQTAVLPAIPVIERELGASPVWSAWLLSSYLVASAVATPLAGRLGDRFGKRRLLLVALGVFLAGSVVAAAAPGLGVLIAARTLQGVGGAVFPLAIALARDELGPEAAGRAIGAMTAAFGLGTTLGVGLSGVLVELVSWRAVFAAGAVALVAALAVVPAGVPRASSRTRARLDLPGAALLAGGLGGVLVALTEGEPTGWGSAPVLGSFAAGVVLLALWARHDLRVPEPLVGLRGLGSRPVVAANLASMALGFVLFGTYLLVPYLVQGTPGEDGYGFSAGPAVVGLYLLPAALGQVVTAPLAGRLAGSRPRPPFVAGLALAAAGAGSLALWHDEPWQVLAAGFLVGCGIGAATTVASAVVSEAVSEARSGVTTALNSVLRRVGGALGGQIAAALLAAVTVAGGTPAEGAFVAGFAVAGVVGLAGAAIALGMGRGPRPGTG